ncbi:MAG TPA: 2-oxoacid:acceptor oxidoreductase family protein [Dehalococcoidia bacterium]|nr:2-oxoacid:acceptor oxidoreductase family protein [Dehalococcoidia bacterium]
MRIHARAGQGAITTAMLLASAAFEEGKEALAFPTFGAERMGAPMNAFVRLAREPIRDRSQVKEPDYVLVLDPTLLRGFDVFAGLKEGGVGVINSPVSLEELGVKTKARVITVPAGKIAEEVLGRADRANTALLGAFAAATGEVSLQALIRVVEAHWPGAVGQKNARAMGMAYNFAKETGK